MAELSYGQRKRLPKRVFAVPGRKTKENPAGKGGFPVPDLAHARAALAMAHGARSGKPASASVHAAVHRKVKRKFPEVLAEHMMRHPRGG